MFARIFLLLPALAAGLLLSGPALAGEHEDGFIAGYARAILDHGFPVKEAVLRVRDSRVMVWTSDLEPVQQTQLKNALESIPGVTSASVSPLDQAPPGIDLDAEKDGYHQSAVDFATGRLFPRGQIFDPLHADVRWPHFSAAYQRFLDHPELVNLGAVSFGETFTLLRNESPYLENLWELGIQAAVHALFDFDSYSRNLVNADYSVGLPLTYRYRTFSAMLRLFHQSSHLGDEYLIANPDTRRINLSYEQLDLLLSQDLPWGFRVYAGGGFMVHVNDPDDLDPWSVQYGLELTSPWTFAGGYARPVAYLDLHNRQESDWLLDTSVRAGVQFQDPKGFGRRFQFLLEYYNGTSPHGQFYTERIRLLGVGVHVYYD
jgi:hypothetical protein